MQKWKESWYVFFDVTANCLLVHIMIYCNKLPLRFSSAKYFIAVRLPVFLFFVSPTTEWRYRDVVSGGERFDLGTGVNHVWCLWACGSSGAMASIFQGCRNGWSADETLAWAKPLGLEYLSSGPMVDWVSGCVQARTPKAGLIFRYIYWLTRGVCRDHDHDVWHLPDGWCWVVTCKELTVYGVRL